MRPTRSLVCYFITSFTLLVLFLFYLVMVSIIINGRACCLVLYKLCSSKLFWESFVVNCFEKLGHCKIISLYSYKVRDMCYEFISQKIFALFLNPMLPKVTKYERLPLLIAFLLLSFDFLLLCKHQYVIFSSR